MIPEDARSLAERYPSVKTDGRRLRPARANRRAAAVVIVALVLLVVLLALTS